MQVKNFGKGKNIADIILVLALLIVGLSVFLIIELSRDAGDSVRVYSNGEFVGEYSLSVDGEYSLTGGTNVLKIENGNAYMSHADCPDHLCIKQGDISRTGEKIVCLPNRLSIEVFGTGEEILSN